MKSRINLRRAVVDMFVVKLRDPLSRPREEATRSCCRPRRGGGAQTAGVMLEQLEESPRGRAADVWHEAVPRPAFN